MKRYYYLSHVITGKTPVYGGGIPVGITGIKSLLKGDSANTYKFTMGNHVGTHIDAPNHFFKQGIKISDYPAGYFIFRSP
ncbi:MAG: cyclase family protein, partial [Candidatus Omnitrophica bacterium]|nr:cyclase family protein [Candidatus Omnitrophota bacterium]